jgi:triacylglycerol lipase
MVSWQLRLGLAFEFLAYGILGALLVARGGWAASGTALLALAIFFGWRLVVVAVGYLFLLADSDPVPADLRIGPLRAAIMVLEEYFGLILLFAVIMPFEGFWLGPDRLARTPPGRLPLLLIHGYQVNRGFWFWLRPKLEASGWVVATLNLEPACADIDDYADLVSRRIDEVLAATAAPRLILVGHSMGGLTSRAYLRRYGDGKVARLVTLGSPHHGSRLALAAWGSNGRQMHIGSPWLAALAAPGAVPLPAGSVSIYSCHDNQVMPQRTSSQLDGARLVAVGGISHLGMAFSAPLLAKLRQALEAP